MFVIPVGSDATLSHRPLATIVIVSVFAVITAAVWIAHPAAILDGIPGLLAAQSEQRGEAAWRHEDEHAEAVAAEVEKLGHPTAASLADTLGLNDKSQPRGEDERALAVKTLTEARDKGWIDAAAFTDMSARLAAAPVLSKEDALAHSFGLDDAEHPFMNADDLKLTREQISQALSNGAIDGAQAKALLERLGKIRIVEDAYPGLYGRIEGHAKRPLSGEEVEQIGNGIDYAAHEGRLLATEATELHAKLAASNTVSSAVAERAVDDADDIPWYLAPVGVWSNPLRWLLSLCVHPRWSDALAGIGFTWSFCLVVEGLVGTRRFLILFGGAAALSCLWTQFTGIFAPAILVHAGSSELRACLAGMLVMWVPTNAINYVRWLFVPIGEFDIAIWKIIAFSTVIGLIGGAFSGFPLPVALAGQLIFPVAGMAAGYVAMRQGWVAQGGWDLLFLWQTRKLDTTERSTLQRERGWQEASKSAAAAPDTTDEPTAAALLAEAETEITGCITAGQLDVAMGLWKATKSSSPAWSPAPGFLYALLKTLYAAKRDPDVQQVAYELIRLYPTKARDARLVLASQALAAKRPASAREQLDGIATEEITPQAKTQIVQHVLSAF